MSTEQIAARLAEHPWIASAHVDGDRLVLRPTRAATAVRPEPGPLITEYLEHWGEVYDHTYTSARGRHAEDLDLSGWRSTQTGEPFPVEHMADWVDRTVELVLATGPKWLLELGCGTGLLAHRLRPHLAGYVGTDVAQSAVDRLAAAHPDSTYALAAAHEVAGPVVREALRRAGFPDARPDCVLINSVTQHFPNVEYLTAVVADAVAVVAPGGVVIVGDVRHAGLLTEHWTRVEAARADQTDLAARVAARIAGDDELSFDPATLAAAAARTGRAVTISAHPKALRADTELTRYRFDAVLRVEQAPAPRPPTRPWSGTVAVGSALVTGIPNALLVDEPDAVTAHDLRAVVRDAQITLDPADPTRLAVVSPAAAAGVPVEEWARLPRVAHEPFAAFARRRLGELVRAAARRVGVPAPAVTVRLPSVEDADRHADAAIDPADARRMPDFLAELDNTALLAMAATLAPALPGDSPRTAEEIADALGAAPRHRWILRRWLATLVAARLLTEQHDAYFGLRPVTRADVDTATREVERSRLGLGYPADLTRFFQTAAVYLPELLRDEITLQSLLFADGETTTADSAYRDNTVNRYTNAAVAHLVRAHTVHDRPVAVLEVGAGVGATTSSVLAALSDLPIDYLFTDVTRFFLVDAKARFGEHPGVRFATFDINEGANDLPPGTLDVIIAANVLHNARNIHTTLTALHDLLRPGGLLVFVDTVRELPQILTSMQFLMSPRPGHAQPGTGDLRAGTDRIFLSTAEWTAELEAAGFRVLGCLPEPHHALHPIGVHVLAAIR